MSRRPQRIIEHALLDGVGPFSAAQLLALLDTEWELLRSAITDARRAEPPRAWRAVWVMALAVVGVILLSQVVTQRFSAWVARLRRDQAHGPPRPPGLIS